jgi:hypothetical protein
MKVLKVLIGCEESQAVCKEFRKLGHEAYSCDLQECSGGYPEWHLQCDIREQLKEYYDLVIFHPVCKFLTNSGVRWLHTDINRWFKMFEGAEFFNLRHQFNSDFVATENPIPNPYAAKLIGDYDQCFQPWYFGHQKMKATCLWLKGLPPLKPTNIVGPPPKDKKERLKWQDVWMCPPGPEREKLRSKTYQGVAEAIAKQYSEYVINQKQSKVIEQYEQLKLAI